jgi:hypothetical protein
MRRSCIHSSLTTAPVWHCGLQEAIVPLEAIASTAARKVRALATTTCFSAYNVASHCSRLGN